MYTLEQLEDVGIHVPGDSVAASLTSQQELFCQAYVFGGLTKTAAYRHAYNVGDDTKRESVNRMAVTVSQLPHVRSRIDQLYASRSRQSSLDTVKIKDLVINQLVETLEHSDNEKLQLQAAVALAKMPAIGLYERPTDDDAEANKGTVLELKAIVKSLKTRIESAETKPPSDTDK